MIQFPDEFISLHDQVIDHVNTNSPTPAGLDQFIEWIETEYLYDALEATWEGERVALHLGDFANYNFCDPELISYEDPSEPITDRTRVTYARKLVRKTFLESDGYDCPSIHLIQIKKSDHTSAVLGWTVAIHSQGGPVLTFCGAFLSKENFYQYLRDSNYLLNQEEDSLTDEVILKLWDKS